MNSYGARRFARRLVIIAQLAIWLLVASVAGWTHATLLHTDPLANTKLPFVPKRVRLTFSERVEPLFNSIRVADSHGRRVDTGEARLVGEGDTVEVTLGDIADGPYGVSWRINSADGHQVQGRFGFGVRTDPPNESDLPGLLTTERALFWKYFNPIVRWISLTSLALWLGGVSFLLFAILPAIAPNPPAQTGNGYPPSLTLANTRLLWTGTIVFFIAAFLELAGKTATFADASSIGELTPSLLATMIRSTNYGMWWLIELGAAIALVVCCIMDLPASRLINTGKRRRSLVSLAAPILFSSLILLTIPMRGHAGAEPQWQIAAIFVDWLHLAATVAWIGGLLHLALVLFALRRQTTNSAPLQSTIAFRFSTLAKVSVGVLVVSGIYNTWLHLPGFGAFLQTDYGRTLLLKLAVFVPMVAMGALNLKRVVPALELHRQQPASENAWAARFPLLVRGEALLGLVILGLVALLTNLPPASTVVAAGPVTLTNRSGNVAVKLLIDPNKAGKNRVAVTLSGNTGQQIADAKKVTVYLRSADMEMGLTTVETTLAPDGSYFGNALITMAGRWVVSVEITPRRGDPFVTEFKISTTL